MPTRPAQTRRGYEIARLAGDPPVVDGQLDAACWLDLGEWSSGYTQLSPKYGAEPSHQTAIKILYDDRNLYVAIRAYDDPIAQRARQLGERDGFAGDTVGVNFDSYHDQRTTLNPIGGTPMPRSMGVSPMDGAPRRLAR